MSNADAAPKSGPATSEAATRTAGPKRRRLVVVVLAVLVVVAGVAVGVLGLRAVDAEESVATALATARANVSEVYSYDSATLDDDLARARSLITGAFAAQFEQTARDVIVPARREQSFTVTAEVTRAALVDIQPDRVDVLLFVDQTVRASTQPQPQRQTLQLAVSMTKDADGPWLISDVTPL